jgi:hypothetical protein
MQLDSDKTVDTKLCSTLEKRRRKIAEFMTKNCENVFFRLFKQKIFEICKDIPKESSYMYTRTALKLFFRILTEDYLKTLKIKFINRLVSYFYFNCQ